MVVGQARDPQLHVGALPGPPLGLHRAVEPDHAGVREADAVVRPVDPPPGDDAGGGLHRLRLPGEAVLEAVAADAAGPVAAHLPGGAVGVVKEHPVVAARAGPLHHHQAVRADGQAAVAQRPGQSGKDAVVQALHHIVDEDKVISRAVHFRKSQIRSSSHSFLIFRNVLSLSYCRGEEKSTRKMGNRCPNVGVRCRIAGIKKISLRSGTFSVEKRHRK